MEENKQNNDYFDLNPDMVLNGLHNLCIFDTTSYYCYKYGKKTEVKEIMNGTCKIYNLIIEDQAGIKPYILQSFMLDVDYRLPNELLIYLTLQRLEDYISPENLNNPNILENEFYSKYIKGIYKNVEEKFCKLINERQVDYDNYIGLLVEAIKEFISERVNPRMIIFTENENSLTPESVSGFLNEIQAKYEAYNLVNSKIISTMVFNLKKEGRLIEPKQEETKVANQNTTGESVIPDYLSNMMPTEEERQNDDYENDVIEDNRETLDGIPINKAKIAEEITEMILERLYKSIGKAVEICKSSKLEMEDINNE